MVGDNATPERIDIRDLEVDIPAVLRNELNAPVENEERMDILDMLDRVVDILLDDAVVRPVYICRLNSCTLIFDLVGK